MTERKLVWVHRDGREEPIAAPSGYYQEVRLSPDGSRVALSHIHSLVENTDVWVLELERPHSAVAMTHYELPGLGLDGRTMTRFTVDPRVDRYPLWSPDGTRLIFLSHHEEERMLYEKATL